MYTVNVIFDKEINALSCSCATVDLKGSVLDVYLNVILLRNALSGSFSCEIIHSCCNLHS